ncbi:hypothetical protein VTJ49DRAFT_3778 [Mycothermus thermophilus]|uniref:Transcription factor n=1 Tax=Humicola insolens TaxID=85995 RepID=A0ABR3V6T9_HUMIN
MAGRPPSNRSSQPAAAAPPRQNEYFVPRDGIDREVIQSDICRYLGNDALVRPGTYETDTGEAMIEDLKADSARWQAERRAAASRNTVSPVGGSRDPPRDQNYNTWKARQEQQDRYQAEPYGGAMDVDSYPPVSGAVPNPAYPAAQAYPGQAPVGYHQGPYPPPAQPHYQPPPPNYGYPSNPQQPQYSPQPQNGDRYQTMPPPQAPIPAGYGQDPYVRGSDYQAGGYAAAAPNRGAPPMPHVSGAPPRTYPSPAPPGPIYGNDRDQYGGYHPQAGGPPVQPYPTDALYGRGAYPTATTAPNQEASSDDLGSPAGAPQRPPFGSAPDPAYDDPQQAGIPKPTSPAAASSSPIPPPGAPPARRERDRDSDSELPRDQGYRDYKSRRTDVDREDRDRNRHRR